MKCVVELTEAEDQTLQQLSMNHKHRDVRTRAAGGLLLGLVTDRRYGAIPGSAYWRHPMIGA